MTADLFDSVAEAQPSRENIADGAVLLRGFVKPIESGLIDAVRAVVAQSPFRRMTTPGGHLMSVAMTNCGERGWITDHTGYRYDPIDPRTGAPWPAMPPLLADLARRAAEQGGFEGFAPDACLVNRYEPGTRLSLHQDKDELDYSAPIVSVSLGLPATFLFGGLARADKPRRFRLVHGDVVVWGGASRLVYHGVAPLADGEHPLLGRKRINLTFRRTR
ncbi:MULTISPECIES: DNA oxidative demethylase AlkB [unclassified Bradyrhizobium]|uniref:DNA oxidative demethylase AlkB n=1 Tax=unclassified Bradyrhizobium TaxID=2631580 RepID=UPI000D65E646|nr:MULTISPECIES: DNA oxidative demethylase AlkB [unclassified Bradyrhizobium]MCA1373290.1 DNA oxidative demethylase AlkB [Bradyrhizobium sp. IC4060]MCA1477758.1 DNA oxidative demethylase AlkB [Bradyrhizobium sp. NBAIM08]MCA1484551.1 DNA oxidative demethylase AlkB [Bradyrhizobium sp. IC4061]MCA1542124.1 DNA oxidative demethylase AlkB [Bradyrhizobium sp. NBAIM32]PWE79840.1 alpha-ketoglutarate-dependent dioxygenase [Bradyrhizobium sp. SUTN9-2]